MSWNTASQNRSRPAAGKSQATGSSPRSRSGPSSPSGSSGRRSRARKGGPRLARPRRALDLDARLDAAVHLLAGVEQRGEVRQLDVVEELAAVAFGHALDLDDAQRYRLEEQVLAPLAPQGRRARLVRAHQQPEPDPAPATRQASLEAIARPEGRLRVVREQAHGHVGEVQLPLEPLAARGTRALHREGVLVAERLPADLDQRVEPVPDQHAAPVGRSAVGQVVDARVGRLEPAALEDAVHGRAAAGERSVGQQLPLAAGEAADLSGETGRADDETRHGGHLPTGRVRRSRT